MAPAYRPTHDGHLGRGERRVMAAIELCRTAALGGHVETCDDCALSSVAYNSCRNRHCPKCQGATRDRDYLHGNAPRSMTLAPHEFIRRFLLQPARRLPPHPPLRLPRQRHPPRPPRRHQPTAGRCPTATPPGRRRAARAPARPLRSDRLSLLRRHPAHHRQAAAGAGMARHVMSACRRSRQPRRTGPGRCDADLSSCVISLRFWRCQSRAQDPGVPRNTSAGRHRTAALPPPQRRAPSIPARHDQTP